MVMSQDQNAGRSHNMKSDNKSFKTVEEFKYLGANVTNQMLFRKKFRAAHLTQGMIAIIQNVLSFSLLPKI